MTSPSRGRPRPQETIRRDERVVELLRAQPRTRNELAELLGCSPHVTYLALWRLAHRGVARVQLTRPYLWELVEG